MEINRPRRYKFRNQKNKTQMDWPHTKKIGWGIYQKLPFYGTLKEVGREEDLRIAGEDRSSKKWVEAGMN